MTATVAMKMGKAICCLYAMHKNISCFLWTLEGVKDYHIDFCCLNSEDFLKITFTFQFIPSRFSCIIAVTAIHCVNENSY